MTDDLVLPDHPYKGKFTAEQVREALDRKDKLVALLMDPVAQGFAAIANVAQFAAMIVGSGDMF